MAMECPRLNIFYSPRRGSARDVSFLKHHGVTHVLNAGEGNGIGYVGTNEVFLFCTSLHADVL